MRLKLDENMPRLLAETLRGAGHDVHTAADEGLLGKPDETVWHASAQERRMLLTLDRDFGRLAAATGGHAGAIVLRPRDANQRMIVEFAMRALGLAGDIDMSNRVAIFEDERVRIRPPLTLVTPKDQA